MKRGNAGRLLKIKMANADALAYCACRDIKMALFRPFPVRFGSQW
jgi:hypothetical protein